MPSFYRLYYAQLKEIKILWGPGAGGRRPDNPNTLERLRTTASVERIMLHKERLRCVYISKETDAATVGVF